MTVYEFNQIISPIETLFFNISDDEIRDMYYGRFRLVDELIFKKAIDYIIDTHKTKTFPLPAEIYDAIAFVKSQMIIDNNPAAQCDKCLGMGQIVEECTDEVGRKAGYKHAIFCDCMEGKRRKRGWKLHDSRRRYKTKKEIKT